MYTTIQLPRNGCRRLSHQSPSLGLARAGPASPNKTTETTTKTATAQSSSFNALTITSARDSAGGVPNPGAAGDPLTRRGFVLLGCPWGAGGCPPLCAPPARTPGPALALYSRHYLLLPYKTQAPLALWGCAGTSALPAAPSALLGTALTPPVLHWGQSWSPCTTREGHGWCHTGDTTGPAAP